MPIACARDDENLRLVLTATGKVTEGDINAQIDRQIADGVWQYAVLYDIRGAPEFPEMSTIFDLVALVRDRIAQYGPRGPVAIVTDRAHEQRAWMYASLTDASRMTVSYFSSMEDATAWLAQVRQPERGPS